MSITNLSRKTWSGSAVTVGALLLGILVGVFTGTVCRTGAFTPPGDNRDAGEPTGGSWATPDTSAGGLSALLPSGFLGLARAELDEGEYAFFPNRRSIWVVNRTNGRMAHYHFRDDEVGSVDRSRIATIDLKAFPVKDTVIQLSDRNLHNILWVCNQRTGDMQMWSPAIDGTLRAEMPVATSADLRTR